MDIGLGGPLTHDEYATLDDLLEECGGMDLDTLYGLLSAVAVAPGLIPPSAWLPEVLPEGALQSKAEATTMLGLLMRLHNDVLAGFETGGAPVPEAGEVDAMECFAFGYVMGASLDPIWMNDDVLWSYAVPFAYLAGERRLVPTDLLAELDASSDALDVARKGALELLGETYDTFKKLRATTISGAKQAVRTGRNDPCACGSGKKHKKCCGAPVAHG
ncbi:MAG: UPF0149 family protein [Myxococcales bacterium]|nr:UPF0149 family protein [Myxococcales bacterium]